MEEDIYLLNGFKGREDYLRNLADNFGMDYNTVRQMADLLGDSEDFDGLVVAIEDNVY